MQYVVDAKIYIIHCISYSKTREKDINVLQSVCFLKKYMDTYVYENLRFIYNLYRYTR